MLYTAKIIRFYETYYLIGFLVDYGILLQNIIAIVCNIIAGLRIQ